MELDQYQERACKTAAPPDETNLAVLTLGLAGETGEVVELVKKHIGHGKSLSSSLLCDELGDVLWYLAVLAAHFGISLNDLAIKNVMKLKNRYPDGFVEGGGNRVSN